MLSSLKIAEDIYDSGDRKTTVSFSELLKKQLMKELMECANGVSLSKPVLPMPPVRIQIMPACGYNWGRIEAAACTVGFLLGVFAAAVFFVQFGRNIFLGRGRIIMVLLSPICLAMLGWGIGKSIVSAMNAAHMKRCRIACENEYQLALVRYKLACVEYERRLRIHENCMIADACAKQALVEVIQTEMESLDSLSARIAENISDTVKLAQLSIEKAVMRAYQEQSK